MWQATPITATINLNGSITFTIKYDNDDGRSKIFSYPNIGSFTPDFLELTSYNEIKNLDAVDARKLAADAYLVTIQPKLNKIVQPYIPPIPTQDELDTAKFFEDKMTLAGMQKNINIGIKKATDQDFIDLQTSIKQRLSAHPEYQNDARFLL